ncbi:MAG: lipopolysaccharide biosynthesis protein [Bacteroidota bacterium]
MENGETSYTKHTLKGFGWLSGGAVVQSFSQIIVLSVLARILLPSDFGVVNVIMILVGFSTIFIDIGIGASLVQLKNISDKHIYNGYIVSILLGILIGLAFYFGAPLFAAYFKIPDLVNVIRVFGLYFPIRCIGIVPESLLQRNLKFKTTVSIQNFSYLVGFGVTSIVCAYLKMGYWALIYAQFAQLIISSVMLFYNQRIAFNQKIDFKILKELVYTGSGYSLATFFNFFAENGDNMVVGRTLGAVQLGLYGRAFQLFAMPARFFGVIFDKVFFPILSRKRDDSITMDKVYMSSLVVCHLLLMPVSVVLIVLAPEVITILLGKGWNQIVLPFQILAISLSCRFGTKINKSFIKSLGIVYKGALYQFIFSALIIVFSIIGSYTLGLVGVAIGVLAANVFNYLQTLVLICKQIQSKIAYVLRIHVVSIFTTLALLLITLAITLLFRKFVNYYLVVFALSAIIISPIAVYLILFSSRKFLAENYGYIKEKTGLPDSILVKLKRFKNK